MPPLLGGLILLLLSVTPVLGHADLESSDPKNKAMLDTPPTIVTLTFTEGLDAGKSSFTLEGPAGDVGTAKPARDGSKRMTLEDLELAPGAYSIAWTAAAEDGHIERGTLGFSVLEPTPPPATPAPQPTAAPSLTPSVAPTSTPLATEEPVASDAPSSEAPSSGDGGTVTPAASTSDVLLPIVAGLVLVGAIGFLVLRRNRPA